MSRFEERPSPLGPEVRVLGFVPDDTRGVLDAGAWASLSEHASAIAADAGVRLVLLEGAREDLFAAGADLDTIAALTPLQAGPFADAAREALAAWEALEATTAVLVRGACAGGAVDLVLACDLVLATPGARFAHPGTRRGILTGWGGTVRAFRRLAPHVLTELFVEGEAVSAERALANGLVDVLLTDPASLEGILRVFIGERGEALRSLKRVSRAVEGLPAGRALVVEERLADLEAFRKRT